MMDLTLRIRSATVSPLCDWGDPARGPSLSLGDEAANCPAENRGT
jgi:hypothetical protein